MVVSSAHHTSVLTKILYTVGQKNFQGGYGNRFDMRWYIYIWLTSQFPSERISEYCQSQFAFSEVAVKIKVAAFSWPTVYFCAE